MNQPKVGDLVVGWQNYWECGLEAIGRLDKINVGQPFPYVVRSSPQRVDSCINAQKIDPEQIINVINGEWNPEEPLKEGDLVVVWDSNNFSDICNRYIGVYRNLEQDNWHSVHTNSAITRASWKYAQKISLEEIPNVFKPGWRPK